MHVISRKLLKEFWEKHPDAEDYLKKWFAVVKKARWQDIAQVRRIFSSADAVRVKSGRNATVFNVKGNKYRLITLIAYEHGRVFTKQVLTHSEYSRGKWKDTL